MNGMAVLTTLSVTVNSSETEFQSDASAYLNEEDRYDTVNFDPNTRWILSGEPLL